MISIIVAVAENGVIGRRNQLPWHLSTDLKRFKSLTMGHHLVMGRKTWDSVGRPLPGRVNVVITRDENFRAEGAVVVHSLEDALRISASDPEVFIAGGAEIFRAALPIAHRMHLTRVHAEVEGDVYFPDVDWTQWREVDREMHAADEKNDFACTFFTYDRT